MTQPKYRLKVRLVGSSDTATCDFELLWGQDQTLTAEFQYPPLLSSLYQRWQEAYVNYYAGADFRAGVKHQGVVEQVQPAPIDWRSRLVETEAALLDQFHHWLRDPALHDIRAEMTHAAQHLPPGYDRVDLFLTCSSPELARLPWETWEVGSDLGGASPIRIARKPANIPYVSVKPIRRKARVLVIYGSAEDLNLKKDVAATKLLERNTQICQVQWQPDKDAEQIKAEVSDAIANPLGWDMLLFAGHSRTTTLTGGQLGIAPNVTIHVSELAEPLRVAQQRGLQFALFNSCDGIGIAESLIELGLSQVVVMREPIRDDVAPLFLRQFLTAMANHRDVHTALEEASAHLLRQKQRVSYPSAYLVPSIFRHPEAAVFQIEPFGWRQRLQKWQPTKPERRWIAALLLLSLMPPIQDLLLEPRLLAQAVYREATGQLPTQSQPPVLMIEIDEASLKQDDVQLVYDRYMNYGYLARLVNALSERQAQVVGIDYLLDKDAEQPEQSQQLQAAIQAAISKKTWFVFAAREALPQKLGVSPEIANLKQSMEGDVDLWEWYVELLPEGDDCVERCPFGYLLALSHAMRQTPDALPPYVQEPSLSKMSLRTAVVGPPKQAEDRQTGLVKPISQDNEQLSFLQQLRLPSWTSSAHKFWQRWWHPILDFSIPESQVMRRVSACQVLDTCVGQEQVPEDLRDWVVLVGHGGYEQAGLKHAGDDVYEVPLALSYSRSRVEEGDSFTGAEAHAYMVHHFLRRHLVIPVPDGLLILVAALMGKGLTLIVAAHSDRRRWCLWGGGLGAVAYVVVSGQMFITAAVLVPVGLPLVMFWSYCKRI